MAEKRKLRLRLLNLYCYITDESGTDEIYLILEDRKIWPDKGHYFAVSPGTYALRVDLNGFDPGVTLDIEVWDYDFISANDLLGTIHIILDEPGGPYLTDMVLNQEKSCHAKYSLEWELDYFYHEEPDKKQRRLP